MMLHVDPASVTETVIIGPPLGMALAFAVLAAIGMWTVFGR